MSDKEEKEHMYITYPASGGTKSLGAGETIIDLYTGKVTLPDRTSDPVGTSEALAASSFKRARSITIETNQAITVRLDGRGEYSVSSADFFTAINQNFRYIMIRTTTTTTISVWASTHPEGVIARIAIGTLVTSLAALLSAIQTTNTIQKAQSDKDSHFTGALAQYESEEENITSLAASKITITDVVILSGQQLNYRLHFYGTDAFDDSDLDTDSWLGYVDLDLPSNGIQYKNTGKYMLQVSVDLDYIDADSTTELHMVLENLDATSKNAGATGEVVIKVLYHKRD